MGDENAEHPAPETDRRGYEGPERRRCERGAFCINVAEAKGETKELSVKVNLEYWELQRRLDALSDLVKALPKEVAAQFEKERREMAAVLKRGTDHFDEIFKRLNRLDKAMIALYVIVGAVTLGKGFAWLWSIFMSHGAG